MQLPYNMGLHNALQTGRYVKPCYKAIAFHISMTAPKYAINPLISLSLSLFKLIITYMALLTNAQNSAFIALIKKPLVTFLHTSTLS